MTAHATPEVTPVGADAPQALWVVVMGVAGCGKSTIARCMAQALGITFIEGDAFHSPENVQKMTQGIALDDADRQGWLDRLGEELQQSSGGAVLSCSALKRAYRDRLRRAAPALRFVHLRIDQDLANARVAARAPVHLFPTSLVASQFAALEDPVAEPLALQLDGALAPSVVCQLAVDWIRRTL